jgi:lysophospholipase-2
MYSTSIHFILFFVCEKKKLQQLITQMPYVKFILPTAPTQPVTLNMGMSMPSWYDIVGLDERSNEECHGIIQSRDRIHDILRKEHNRGVPYSRMSLAGFSQGGALCLYAGLSLLSSNKLAGILVLSGYLAGASTFQLTPGLEDVPILHLHGSSDPIVAYSLAHKSKESLSIKGIKNYEIKTYPGMQHTAIQEEIEDALNFLRTILPPVDDQSRINIKLKNPSDMSVAELKEALYREGLTDKARNLVDKQDLVKLLHSHRELR